MGFSRCRCRHAEAVKLSRIRLATLTRIVGDESEDGPQASNGLTRFGRTRDEVVSQIEGTVQVKHYPEWTLRHFRSCSCYEG